MTAAALPLPIMRAGDLCPELQFDEAEHKYTIMGREIPGITTVLRDCGLIDVSPFTDAHREFGVLRHYVTQLDDEGDLDEGSVDEQLIPTLHGWRKWRDSRGFVATHIECRVHSELGYATAVDRVGYFKAKPDEPVLLNIKGPTMLPSYGIQMAAETHAFEERTGMRVIKRLGVHISRKGVVKEKQHEGDRDLMIWLAALNLWTWRRENL